VRFLFVLIAALALALVVASTVEVAKVDAKVKTGKWSYAIEAAYPKVEDTEERGRGGGREEKICRGGKVEVTREARSVTVTMYNCTRAVVEVRIRSDATVPICLTSQGPVEGYQHIPLRPGDAVWRTFVFVDNGTLTFSVSVGTC